MTQPVDVTALEWGHPERCVQSASDEDLALAARADIRYFETLYERHADRLYRYALSRTGSPETAADLVSQTMVSALEGLERFDPSRGSFTAWLFTIASRRIADRQRAHRRFQRYLKSRLRSAEPQEEPLERIDRDEDRARVRAAIQQLSETHREVILLRHVAELPIAEIATTLNISEGAVKMRLNRALKQLANDLGGDDDDES